MHLALRSCLLILAFLTFQPMPPAAAHEMIPALADLTFDRSTGRYTLKIDLNLEALIAGVEPEIADTNESEVAEEYDALRALDADALGEKFDDFKDRLMNGIGITVGDAVSDPTLDTVDIPPVGDFELVRQTKVVLTGPLPADAQTFQFQWIPDFGPISLRVDDPTGRDRYVALLRSGTASDVLSIDDLRARTTVDIIVDYIVIGFEHILPKGLDHILFVVGIFLLSTQLRPIFWQVTAFTVAHTVTLGMGAAGIFELDPGIVEPLIAASIVYVAVENIWLKGLSPWRPFVVFGFGLLHGLGFAGVLYEIGIPEGQFLITLLSFNVGVELGQLAVIAICFALVGIWFGKKPWYRARVTVPGSLIIAAVGAYWFFERTVL